MDISETTAPKSDQQNFDDYVNGPKTVTVTEVKAGSPEQPVEIHLQEFAGRPYKPSKSMRRVLVTCWGSDSSTYIGRRITLYGDPSVRFGGSATGGIKISHLSDIDKAIDINLTITRGKRAPHQVRPLETVRAAPTPVAAVDEIAVTEWVDAINAATSLNQLQAAWEGATQSGVTRDPRVIAAKDARKAELA